MLDLLKNYVNDVDHRNQWKMYLPLVEYAYNNTVHSSTRKSPLEIIEGRPKVPPILRMHQNIFVVDEYVRDLQTSFEKIKDAIKITQLKQKSVAVKHRRSLDFKIDDWVLLKFPKAGLGQMTGKDWQGMPSGHQKYYAKLARQLLWTFPNFGQDK